MSTSTLVVLEEEQCVLITDEEGGEKVRSDIILWILVSLFLALILIVCVAFTYVAVNMNKNLGTTWISPFQFYPGQFLQNDQYFFTLEKNGILQLSSTEQGGVYWTSTNLFSFSPYGLVGTFGPDGGLWIENAYGQILWSITPTDSNHAPPFILHLDKEGHVVVRSSIDGTEVLSIP